MTISPTLSLGLLTGGGKAWCAAARNGDGRMAQAPYWRGTDLPGSHVLGVITHLAPVDAMWRLQFVCAFGLACPGQSRRTTDDQGQTTGSRTCPQSQSWRHAEIKASPANDLATQWRGLADARRTSNSRWAGFSICLQTITLTRDMFPSFASCASEVPRSVEGLRGLSEHGTGTGMEAVRSA